MPDRSALSDAAEALDYVGVRPVCGCVTAWMSSDSTDKEVRDFYVDMAKTGREVRRAALEDVRDKLGSCEHIRGPSGGR